jgi:hypothetical protein
MPGKRRRIRSANNVFPKTVFSGTVPRWGPKYPLPPPGIPEQVKAQKVVPKLFASVAEK